MGQIDNGEAAAVYRVLIVDDEALLRQGLRSMFRWEEAGFQVMGEAANGKEALDLVEGERPDVVITDVRMPVMDGVELTHALQEHFPQVGVVILSSYNDFDYVRKTLLLGAVDYILKPRLNRTELLVALEKAVARTRREVQNPDLAFYAFCSHPPVPGDVLVEELEVDLDEIQDKVERTELCQAAKILCQSVERSVARGRYPLPAELKRMLTDCWRQFFFHARWLGSEEDQPQPLLTVGVKRLEQAGEYQICMERFCRYAGEAEVWLESAILNRMGPVLGQVWRYLWQHYDQALSLTSVSDRFYINKSYLCQLFSKQKTSFSQLLHQIRIQRAKVFLQNPAYSVAEVGEKVGYVNNSYFMKQFRKQVGCSPGAFQAYGVSSDFLTGDSLIEL